MASGVIDAVEGSNKEWSTTLTMRHYAGEDEEDQLTESEFGIRNDKSSRATISKKKILKRSKDVIAGTLLVSILGTLLFYTDQRTTLKRVVFNLVHCWITYARLYTLHREKEHQGSPIYGYLMSTKLLYMFTERDMKRDAYHRAYIYCQTCSRAYQQAPKYLMSKEVLWYR